LVKPRWFIEELADAIPDIPDEDEEVDAKAVPDARARPAVSKPTRPIPAFRVPSILSRFVPIMKLPPGKTGHTPVVGPLVRTSGPSRSADWSGLSKT
jgi:hypothetical protein